MSETRDPQLPSRNIACPKCGNPMTWDGTRYVCNSCGHLNPTPESVPTRLGEVNAEGERVTDPAFFMGPGHRVRAPTPAKLSKLICEFCRGDAYWDGASGYMCPRCQVDRPLPRPTDP